MKRNGRTPDGHLLWQPWEDDILRAFYPDYRAMRRKLRKRSYDGIRYRVRVLGIARKNHVWLTTEEQRLRRLFAKADRDEILASFSGMSWSQISKKAQRLRLRRPRRQPKPTGHSVVDVVLERAFSENISRTDLDFLSRSKRYFRNAGRLANVNGKALLRAIDVLGGEITIRWR